MDPPSKSRHTCGVCKLEAPKTETPHTLIGASYGWRCIFDKDTGGRKSQVWFCPKCWRERKKKAQDS